MITAIDMVKLLSSQQKCPKQESNNFVIIIMLNYFTNGNRAKNSKISSATNIHRKVLGIVLTKMELLVPYKPLLLLQ